MPRLTLDGNPVQLSYSTNVHPAQTLEDMRRFLADSTARVRELVSPGRPFGVCLHLAGGTTAELAQQQDLHAFSDHLLELGLEVVAVNAFPLGDFHAPVVKEKAYSPDWTEPRRRDLSRNIADVFAALLPDGVTGAMSTLAGTFKPWGDDFTIHELVAERMIEVAAHLEKLEETTGRHIVLGLEPEPCTTLETTDETLLFFDRHLAPAGKNAGLGDRWRRYLGLNVDLCHQAVQFESLEDSLDRIHAHGIVIASVHAAAALSIPSPDAGSLDRLSAFDEARYLHQLVGMDRDGQVTLRSVDIPQLLADVQSGELPDATSLKELRCHFHVPLDCETVEGFPTTAGETAAAVRHLLDRGYSRSVVAETYTWGVGPLSPESLPERLAAELNWLIAQVGLSSD